MCGISGIYQFKNSNRLELEKAVELMNKSQSRRGPDDEGIFIDELSGLALGHKRLSILDLSKAGHQPMMWQMANGKWQMAITFNGEIYNFQELRRDLEKKKYKFKTQTDTEVILALYAEYGVKSFSMLRGMFAFGLYDSKNKKLLLVKDHYGIKPLYYYSDGEKIIFASTVRAVAESGLFSIKKSQKAMIGFLLFGSVPLPITTIEGILAVPAGYYMEASLNGERKLVKYYDALDAFLKKSNDDFEDAKVKVKNLIEESIRFHLISDAPLGIFLSGGLDSSTIAALSAEVLRGGGFRHKINTLSVVFNEKEFSEKKYQQLVVDRVKSRHREIKITKGDFEKNFDEIFEAMDQPTIDGVNTYFISKAAKEAEVKTVLSGLGSDEIFMGYSSFKKAVLLRKIQKFPKILKFPLRIFSLFGGRLAKLNYLKKDTPLNFYLTIRGLFTPKEVAKILSINEQEVENFIGELNNSITNNSITKLHPADLLSYFELKFYLQNQLLKDTDFMSMRHSIEIRVPFLDHPLVEYLSSLRPDVKLKNIKIQEYKNINKSLLVEAVRELLPQEIFTRPKMGFTFPFQEWMKGIDSNFKGGHWSRHWAMGVLNKFN